MRTRSEAPQGGVKISEGSRPKTARLAKFFSAQVFGAKHFFGEDFFEPHRIIPSRYAGLALGASYKTTRSIHDLSCNNLGIET